MARTADTCGLVRLKPIGLSKLSKYKPCTLLQAARHNLREAQEERGGRAHIDSNRTRLNVVITGPPNAQGVVALARERMQQAGVDVDGLRYDYVQAIELMFSLPAGSALDEMAYFLACQDWSAKRFGQDNLLSAVIHRDESAPHAHLLFLPLVNGRMTAKSQKSRMAFASMRASFHAEVSDVFGLSRGRERMTAAQRRAATTAVLARLDASRDPCTSSPVWQAIRDSIESDPGPYIAALGLSIDLPEPAPKQQRTLTQIFTSPGKGEKREKANQTQRL